MTPKPWWDSWTLWFNIGSVIIAVATVFTDPALISNPTVVTVAITVVAAGNAALRVLRTAAPIAGTPMAARVESLK